MCMRVCVYVCVFRNVLEHAIIYLVSIHVHEYKYPRTNWREKERVQAS